MNVPPPLWPQVTIESRYLVSRVRPGGSDMQVRTKELQLLVGRLGRVVEPEYPSAWGVQPDVIISPKASATDVESLRKALGPAVESRRCGRLVISPFNYQTRR